MHSNELKDSKHPARTRPRAMGEEEDNTTGSELLLPTVRVASKNDQFLSENHRQHDGEESDGGEGDDGFRYDGASMPSLQSHVTFGSLPSYMRAKSGVAMDPDRFRRRKQMIANLPDAASARKRMQRIATNWDLDKNGQLLGFDCVSLDPTQFKELFRRNFGVLLGARDLGILISMYDKQGEGRADSSEFLKDFWQMGRNGRTMQNRRRLDVVRRNRERHNERLRERADRMSRLKEVAVGDYSEKDVRRALHKISEVAARYDTARDNGFHRLEQGGVMGPTTFREQLRTIFGVHLTRAELGGLVSAFNVYRDGMVDAKEFAFRFHTLGRDCRAARLAEGAARDERARRRKREEEEALTARMVDKSKCKVRWDFTEEELARGKEAIARAASTYDRARLGADIDRIAQMKMDPTAFRTQLLQNFRVKLGPGELGAIFTVFDKDKSMLIDGTELMHEFFRMGREERAKQLAETENHRRRTEKRLRSVRQRIEDRYIEQTVAKVIWPSLTHDPFDEEDFSINDHSSTTRLGSSSSTTKGSTSEASPSAARRASQSCARTMVSESRRQSRQGSGEECKHGGRSARRRKPSISASTADFLARIEQEEMSIHVLTYRGRGHRGCGGNTDDERDECGTFQNPKKNRSLPTPAALSFASRVEQKTHNHGCSSKHRHRLGSGYRHRNISSAGGREVGGDADPTANDCWPHFNSVDCQERGSIADGSSSSCRRPIAELSHPLELVGRDDERIYSASCSDCFITRSGVLAPSSATLGEPPAGGTSAGALLARDVSTVSGDAVPETLPRLDSWGGASWRGGGAAGIGTLESPGGGARIHSPASRHDGMLTRTGSGSVNNRGLSTRGSTARSSSREGTAMSRSSSCAVDKVVSKTGLAGA